MFRVDKLEGLVDPDVFDLVKHKLWHFDSQQSHMLGGHKGCATSTHMQHSDGLASRPGFGVCTEKPGLMLAACSLNHQNGPFKSTQHALVHAWLSAEL